jgi:hypothetical protein
MAKQKVIGKNGARHFTGLLGAFDEWVWKTRNFVGCFELTKRPAFATMARYVEA